MDRFTYERLSTIISTIGLARLAGALLTLIGSCRIFFVFKIKVGTLRKRYLSCNRFAKFEFACLTKKSVINKTHTQNGAQTLYLKLLKRCSLYEISLS